MVRVVIDEQSVEVPEGSTILDAARALGLDIPALCYRDGLVPSTSCMLCLVKVRVTGRLVPSCATLAEDGLRVESETEEIRQLRRAGLELLLSHHRGDCVAPCQAACPSRVDVPLMLRQVAAGTWRDAITTLRSALALPAVLARVGADVSENACRRGGLDAPAAIGLVKRCVADVDLASGDPYVPACKPPSGRKVAIVGAGPAGLSAAYHLLLAGHASTLFDDHDEPGGQLRYAIDSETLPRNVLDAEIALIAKLGAQFRMRTVIGSAITMADLQKNFDALLVAVGALDDDRAECVGFQVSHGRLVADRHTHETVMRGVFAAGDALRPGQAIARAVADGQAAAACIDQYLSGVPIHGPEKPFTVHAGRLAEEELAALAAGIRSAGRAAPSRGAAQGLTEAEAQAEVLRCLHCDCGKQHACKLRHYAAIYGADANRYRSDRRPLERVLQHAEVLYEPSKCILCGLCVQIATAAREPLGLTFIGRGFDVRVGVPFDRSLAEGLQRVARQCADACPTGALTLRTRA